MPSRSVFGVCGDHKAAAGKPRFHKLVQPNRSAASVLRAGIIDDHLHIGRITFVDTHHLDGMVRAVHEEQIRQEILRLQKTVAPPSPRTNAFLEAHGTAGIALSGASLADLLRRPELTYDALAEIDPQRPALSRQVREQVEIGIKYEGYIRRQLKDIEEQRRLEDSPLPPDIDYLSIRTLRTEARQKLQAVRPETLGQAGRISGVSPADVGALMVYLSHREEPSK